MTTIRRIALMLACFATGPALAGTCHMTVLGAPVLDDVPCSLAARRGDARITIEDGGAITIRRSRMSARLPGKPRPDGSRRMFGRSFGEVVASTDSDDKTCYFNQKATICVDP